MKYLDAMKARDNGAIVVLPEHLYIPTLPGYQYALSYYHDDASKAYIDDTDQYQDLSLLRLIYSVWWGDYIATEQWTNKHSIYAPAFSEIRDGKTPVRQRDMCTLLSKLKDYSQITATINTTQETENGTEPVVRNLPVIDDAEYDQDTRLLTVKSRYLAYLVRDIRKNSAKTKDSKPVRDKFGNPQHLKAHHTLIRSNILVEQSPMVVETVFILARIILLQRNPHIGVLTLLDKNPILKRRFDTDNHRVAILKRTLVNAFEILTGVRGEHKVTRTEMSTLYPNLVMPQLDDLTCANICTEQLRFIK